MKNIFLVFLLSMVFVINGTAQNVEFTKENFSDKKELKTALKNIRSGDKIYSRKTKTALQYQQALSFYRQAELLNNNNVLLNLKMADCYYRTHEPERAALYGERAYRLDSTSSYKILFFKAYSLQLQTLFNDALLYYRAFEASSDITHAEALDVKQKIAECENGIILLKTEKNCFIDNLGKFINGPSNEYLPVLMRKDTILYFVSRREQGKALYAIDGKLKENIYSSYKEGKDFTLPHINNKLSKKYEALHTISRNGQYAIVYNSKNGGDLYEIKIKTKKIPGGIWLYCNPCVENEKEKTKRKWAKGKPIKAVNTSYHETSAALNTNGDTLYFSSDRKKGFGGHDIYMSVRNKRGKWKRPHNLGNTVNTEKDEISVSVDSTGKYIYVSSNGHQTMGGFDIFRTAFENSAWSRPENIGYPINTPYDDIYFVMSDDERIAYFSSNRANGQGGQDIYKITFLGEPKMFIYATGNNLLAEQSVFNRYEVQSIEIEKEKTTTVQGIVVDAKTKEPVFSTIELSDIQQSELLATFASDSITGKYTLILPSGKNYGVSVKKEGYLYYSENFNIADSAESQTINQVIALNKIEVNQKIVLKNIFFDINKTTLKPESTIEIENVYKLMLDNPTLEIEISGHTDNTGGAASNKRLSEGRALAVVNALKEKGIDPSRMKSVGYGYEKPIASNKTESGRAQNRRTEFKIIKK
ncbi:MAG: OmpA family protein [Bacteroidales bacterium]|jgi:outer membrane protein OmpA-like peptidoglycan-associated protein|nr:OmpA family protein [Bacteroidales bacterium]